MITSAKTARKQIPALYKLVNKSFGWEKNTRNLDIGGGPWDLFTKKLSKHDVTNYVYDPHNRSDEHNDNVFCELCGVAANTVTIANVLNVIYTLDKRHEVLELARRYLKDDGRVYISVHEGDGNGNSRASRDGWQEHRKLGTYLDEIQEVFPDCHKIGKMIVACK